MSNVLIYTLDFSDYVFLIYSFEELINSSLISILLLHLFDCPRTMFAKSTYLNCSRNFIEVNIIKPSNFKIVSNFQFISFFDLTDLPDESQDIAKDFRTIVFFETYQKKEVINSDRKRCLNTFVVEKPIRIVLASSIKGFCKFFLQRSRIYPRRVSSFILKTLFYFFT